MFNGKRILALIPARGGSKGLPRKNVLLLAGKPLIAWSIGQALASAYVDRVLVSTDDEEIAAAAKDAGADVPFLRPQELATDTAASIDVVLHAVKWQEDRGEHFDIIVLLQPTSPLRSVKDIDTALELLLRKEAAAVVSVCETEHHPYWSNTLPPDGSMAEFLRPELLNRNRQELPRYYRLNGAVYAARRDELAARRGFFGPRTFAHIMPKERSIDIDSHIDFQLAELLMQKELSR